MNPKTSEISIAPEEFRRSIRAWGDKNFRAFPWRLTEDPYRILIAEVMLHRTQAKQVVPIYEEFTTRYPDMNSLAEAERTGVERLLFPLGLRWRIDLLVEMAKQVVERFAGNIPNDKPSLLALPGVSEYIASAMRCFAWNLPEPLQDTNTVRVTGRLFGWQTKDSSRRNAKFRNALTVLVDPDAPRLYNYALLDLAALICKKAVAPVCDACPVRHLCVYGRKQNPLRADMPSE